MSYLYEDDDNEFTSCCGAFSKGCDGYIGCRGCYQEIEEYFSNKKSFRKLIEILPSEVADINAEEVES